VGWLGLFSTCSLLSVVQSMNVCALWLVSVTVLSQSGACKLKSLQMRTGPGGSWEVARSLAALLVEGELYTLMIVICRWSWVVTWIGRMLSDVILRWLSGVVRMGAFFWCI
jgi:hypothetical protein